jgi:hypothetical protein
MPTEVFSMFLIYIQDMGEAFLKLAKVNHHQTWYRLLLSGGPFSGLYITDKMYQFDLRYPDFSLRMGE